MKRPFRAALAIACAGPVAHADTTNDIKNATQLHVDFAQVTLDGESSIPLSLPLSKPAGTLTFDIPASALGIPITGLSLHAMGAPVGNGKILFTTSNTYNPPVALPDGSTLSSEYGTFTMQTWSIDGAKPGCGAPVCSGGTGYQLIGGTMIVTGSFGVNAVTLDKVHGVGGVPRAQLGGFKAPPPLPFCSDTVETRARMKVVLASPAPAGGSRVDLTSSNTSLRFPHSLVVPQGRDTTSVDIGVPAGFTGTFAMRAAAGGVTRTATLAVNAASACVPPPRRYVLEPNASCAACSTFGSLNNAGDRIIAVNGVVQFVHAGRYTDLARLWGASDVGASAINDAGLIVGRFTRNRVTQAYRADMVDGSHEPLLLGAMTPMAIAQGGAVVGFRVDAVTGMSVAVINRGSGVVDIPLTSGYGVRASRALFMMPDATIVGTYTGNDNVQRGFRYRAGTMTTLPAIGGSWSIPTGITANGSIAVNAGTIAAVIAKTGAITQYGSPRGYSQFVVKDINRWGYAVGTATSTGITRAFVYIPGSGFTALSGYVSNLAYADNALAINDDNQIAIHGALTAPIGAGAPPPDYFLLSL
jgi:hypothetical protein